MSKKKKKARRRRPPVKNRSSHPSPGKRRLPAPRMAGSGRQEATVFYSQPEQDSYVGEIVQLIEQMSATSKINPFTIITDWIGMMEASLRLRAENMKTMVMTGKFVEDPPEVKEIFARARARYRRASERYPAVYRMMQDTFSVTFALLLQSAAPGLEFYCRQSELNPDVIGQVFMTCLKPGPAWRQYFMSWEAALTAAREAVRDGEGLICTTLGQAGLRARCDGHTVELEPGENFEEWFELISPYIEPLIIGPSLIRSSAMMLALAAQFPDWAVQRGVVQFWWWGEVDPTIAKMASFNAIAYGLNGHLLDYAQAVAEIQAYQQASPETVDPAPVYQQPVRPEEGTALSRPGSLVARSDQKSFTDLFRQEAADG